MSLLSSSSGNSSTEICFVIESQISNKYQVYIVDVGDIHHGPESQYKKLPPPFFEVPPHYPYLMTFFGFGSKIYFLGGLNPATRGRKKEVYVYDTSNKSGGIKPVQSMNHGKVNPLVIGPIKEKLYVLSHNLFNMDLEEFNPESDSWKILTPPPTTRELHPNAIADINGYVVVFVNDGYKIILSTESGIFSYYISEDVWDFVANKTLPFQIQTGALSIGKDRYLVYQEEDLFGFRIFDYNGTGWDKFQDFDENVLQDPEGAGFFCMSLDDGGLLCAVQSEYKYDDDSYFSDPPPPTKHHIMIVRFVPKHDSDGTKGYALIPFICYVEETYIAESRNRTVINSFPLYKKTDEAALIDPLG